MDSPSSAFACIGIILFPHVPRTLILLHVKLDTRLTVNETATYLENIVDYVLAEFCVDRLGLLLVGSFVNRIGLVTVVAS